MTEDQAKARLKELNFEITREVLKTDSGIVTDMNAIVRNDNKQIVGIVSKNYRLIKHGEAMSKPAATLMEQGFEVTNSFVVNSGAKAILEMRSKDTTKINDENYKTRLYIINSYDGSSALRMQFGLFRLRCLNGLGYVVKNAQAIQSIAHVGHDKLFDKDIVLNFVNQRQQYVQSFENIVKRLADIKVGDEEHAKKILTDMKIFGKTTVKKIIDEWKKDINYLPNVAGLYNGVTSLYSRKIETIETTKPEKAGNRVMSAQWATNAALHAMSEIVA